MTNCRPIIFLLTSAILAAPAAAFEVFKWVDEDGVVHFSDQQPSDAVAGLTRLEIPGNNPANYDPQEDHYSIQNQAARTNEVYKKVAKKRAGRAAERAEADAMEAQPQFVRYYDEPIRSYFLPVVRPGWRHDKYHHDRPPYLDEPKPGHIKPGPRRRHTEPRQDQLAPQPAQPQRPAGAGNKMVRWAPSRQAP